LSPDYSVGKVFAGLSNVQDWLGASKCIDGFLVGTSPELDLSLKTVCAMARAPDQCPMRFGSERFSIQSYVDNHNGRDHIGSAYPIFD